MLQDKYYVCLKQHTAEVAVYTQDTAILGSQAGTVEHPNPANEKSKISTRKCVAETPGAVRLWIRFAIPTHYKSVLPLLR